MAGIGWSELELVWRWHHLGTGLSFCLAAGHSSLDQRPDQRSAKMPDTGERYLTTRSSEGITDASDVELLEGLDEEWITA